MNSTLTGRYHITRDGVTTTSDTLPADMPAEAVRRLALLGVIFYGHGTVKVTDERPEAGSIFLPDEA